MRSTKKRALVSPKEARAKLNAMIQEQGTKPVDDLDVLMKEARGIWPEKESVDEFIEWRRKRREESRLP